MSRRRRQDYIGCSIVERRGRFELQARPRGDDGRKRLKRWPTGLSAERDGATANRARLEPLAKIVGACVRAGRTLVEIDAFLAPALGTSTTASESLSVGPTVREYHLTWIEEQSALVDPALVHSYRGHFDRYILPILGDLPLASLRPKDVRRVQADLLARKVLPRKKQKPTGKTLAVKTVKNVIVGSFAAFIRQARADELVTCDLFAGLQWPKAESPDPDPFGLDEVRRICEWFRDHRFGFPPLPGSKGIRRLPHPPSTPTPTLCSGRVSGPRRRRDCRGRTWTWPKACSTSGAPTMATATIRRRLRVRDGGRVVARNGARAA